MVRTCRCGAKYELIEIHSMIRDKDSLECEVCGTELIHWNGGCFWIAKRIEEPKGKREANDESRMRGTK